jgi:hypothetical protein
MERRSMRQKTLIHFQNGEFKILENEMFVHLTIYDIPTSLLKEFMQRVVNPSYPDGISPAIKDLMWKAIQKRKEKQVPLELQQPQA